MADEVAALGHSYSMVETAPTCTVDGSKVYTCHCGDTYTEEIPATGHSYDAVVTDPTCTEAGYTTYTCHCGDSYVSDHTDATGHQFVDGVCQHCGALQLQIGDANGDGKVNARDARMILRYMAELISADEIHMAAADFNGDNRVNARDARAILRMIAGM